MNSLKRQWRFVGLSVAITTFAFGLSAETILFTGQEHGVEGKILDQTADRVIISFSAEAIASIADSDGKTSSQVTFQPQPRIGKIEGGVFWELDQGTFTIHLPLPLSGKILMETQSDSTTFSNPKPIAFTEKELMALQVERETYRQELSRLQQEIPALKEAIAEIRDQEPNPVSMKELARAVKSGSLEGQIVWKGSPLEGCEVMLIGVRSISFPVPWLANTTTEDSEENETQIFVAKTDKNGLYRFEGIPEGQYRIQWRRHPEGSWIRRLQDRPDVMITGGESLTFPAIEADVRTIN